MEWKAVWEKLWQQHRYMTCGVIAGLIIGIAIVVFGFWKTFFISLCVILGLFIGKLLDDKVDIKSWVADLMGKFDDK